MARFFRSMRLVGAAALTTSALAAPVLGQGFDLRSLFTPSQSTGTVTPPVVPAPANAAPEWSGESGSSGHPTMTADAIRAAAAQLRQLPRRAVAAGRAPRRVAGGLRCRHRGPHARSADHGLDGRPARVHQIVLGLSRHPGQRRAHRKRPRHPGPASCDLRRGREGLRRRPLLHRRHLGSRIQLRHHDRRPLGDPLDRDARLHRPPAGLFPRGISLGAGNPGARRRQSRSPQGFVGGRLRADPVHADLVQALRGRFRRRWPARRRRLGARSHRLDRQQPEEGRLGAGADLGLRGGRAAGLQFSQRRSRARADDAGMGARRHSPPRRQGVPAPR